MHWPRWTYPIQPPPVAGTRKRQKIQNFLIWPLSTHPAYYQLNYTDIFCAVKTNLVSLTHDLSDPCVCLCALREDKSGDAEQTERVTPCRSARWVWTLDWCELEPVFVCVQLCTQRRYKWTRGTHKLCTVSENHCRTCHCSAGEVYFIKMPTSVLPHIFVLSCAFLCFDVCGEHFIFSVKRVLPNVQC